MKRKMSKKKKRGKIYGRRKKEEKRGVVEISAKQVGYRLIFDRVI